MPRSDPSASPPLSVVLSSVVGMASGVALARLLPLVPSTLLSTLVLSAGANFGPRLRHSSHWWGLVGFAAGSLVGTGWVLSVVLKEKHPATALGIRAMVVLLMLLSGAIAGHGLAGPSANGGHSPSSGAAEGAAEGADAGQAPARARRRPAEVLKSASGLTAGAFAALVTLTYVHSGLDGARAFSSRLSTSLTILVVCLAAPGWLAHQWRQRQQRRQHLRPSPRAHASGERHGHH